MVIQVHKCGIHPNIYARTDIARRPDVARRHQSLAVFPSLFSAAPASPDDPRRRQGEWRRLV